MQVHGTIPSVFLRPVRAHVGRKQNSYPFVGFDEVAFQSLVYQYAERVRTLAFALLGSEKMADEACLRVFSRAYTALAKHGEPWIELTRLSRPMPPSSLGGLYLEAPSSMPVRGPEGHAQRNLPPATIALEPTNSFGPA